MGQQSYQTVEAPARREFTEKKSRFIGHIAPVATEGEAAAFINGIRSGHRDATHNVYAYALREGLSRRYSDDGEPQGTAGVPVLEVLQKEGLTDAAIVVTRYFGGILLGGGGLVRAYSHAAKLAVEAARIVEMCPCTQVELECDYSLYGKIKYILPQYPIRAEDPVFAQAVAMRLLIRSDAFPAWRKDMDDLTHAAASIRVLGEVFSSL